MPTCEPTSANKNPEFRRLSKRGFVFAVSKPAKFLLFLLLAITLTSCSRLSLVTLPDPEVSQEDTSAYVASAGPGESLGQTFTMRRPELNSITLWINSSGKDGSLQAELFRSPADEQPIFTENIPYSTFSSGVLTIRIPATLSASRPGPSYGSTPMSAPDQSGSTRGSSPTGGLTSDQSGSTRGSSPTGGLGTLSDGGSGTRPYYILLRPASGTIQARGRAEDIYAGGQAYQNGSPLQADLAFSTTYAYDLNALAGDLVHSLPRLWLVLPLLAVLFLPGWLLLDLSGLKRRFESGERIGLAVGLSLAIIPLAMLWSTVLGLHWNRERLLIAAGVLVAAALWQISLPLVRPDRHPHAKTPENLDNGRENSRSSSKYSEQNTLRWIRWLRRLIRRYSSTLWLAAIFILTLGVRLVQARDLSAPAWVDSVHHAVITRVIMEHGGFTNTYAPYIDINSAEYHAGFHSGLASFEWLSGLATPEAMLLYGQVLNALIVFAVYLLTVSLTRQRAAGLAAAVIAGLFTPMPAYYTSWGRYTQLAGLLILPAGLALARQFVIRRDAKFCVSTIILSAVACGGLFMVHYRVAGFLALLLLAYFLSRVRLERVANAHLVKRTGLFILAVGLLALLLTLPWSWRAISAVFIPKAGVIAGSSATAFEGFYWDYLTTAWGLPAMVLAGLGLLISLFRRASLTFSMAAWTGLLLLVANLAALHLPGGWAVNNISVAIILFMPTAVLAGYALAQAFTLVLALTPARVRWLVNVVIALAGVVISLLAARALLPILRPSTDLFRAADRPAMDWISQHIPSDETILINPMYWGYNTYAGSDGGYWITPLTGRKTIPPPVLYALGSPYEKQRIRTLCDTVLSAASDPASLANYLHGQGISYIYLGARGGELSPQALSSSDRFAVIYQYDGAWIFEVR